MAMAMSSGSFTKASFLAIGSDLDRPCDHPAEWTCCVCAGGGAIRPNGLGFVLLVGGGYLNSMCQRKIQQVRKHNTKNYPLMLSFWVSCAPLFAVPFGLGSGDAGLPQFPRVNSTPRASATITPTNAQCRHPIMTGEHTPLQFNNKAIYMKGTLEAPCGRCDRCRFSNCHEVNKPSKHPLANQQ